MSRPPPPKLGKSKLGPPQEKEGNQDLTTILDTDQRVELTLLIANATESMRKLLVDNFTSVSGLDKRLLKEGMSEDEKLLSVTVDPATADVDAFQREKRLKQQFEKELASPRMQLLKKMSLQAFDEWRQGLIQRVGEVVNSKNVVSRQTQEVKASEAQPVAPEHKALGTVVKAPTAPSRLKLKDIYPPTKTSLTKLSMSERALVLHSLLLLTLSLEHYNALSRVLLLNITSSLKLPLKTFEDHEAGVAKGLLKAAKELSADEETRKKAEANKDTRKWRVGLATAAGATIIGVTGGLAAPLVAAGVGSVMSGLGLGATAAAGYLGSVAGSTMVVGGLFGAYGGRITGKMMDQYAREIEDFAFEPVHSKVKTSDDEKEAAKHASDHDHRLRVTICISGWLTEKEEVVAPWKVLGTRAEVFALRWELEALLNLGNAMNGLASSAAWGYAQKELIKRTIFADMVAAMWPLALLKVSRVIDNPFSVAKGRAEKTGEVLADALINRVQGERPVTLIGYSLGARVIYTCLMSLANRRAFGLVESVVMMGAPTPSDTNDWRIMRSVVSGRLINVYSENDYVLGFMYRTSSIQYGVAGLQKIVGIPSVENFDVSEDISGHTRYRYLIGSILKKLGFEDVDNDAILREQEILKAKEEKEKEESSSKQKDRLMRRQSLTGKPASKQDAQKAEEEDADAEANEMQKDIEQKTLKSMTQWALEKVYLTGVSTEDTKKVVRKATGTYKDPSKAQDDASKAVMAEPGLASKDAQKAYRDPKGTTTGAANKWAAPKLDYAKMAGDYLPSFGSRKEPADTAGKGAPAKAAAKSPPPAQKPPSSPSQSYTQRAAGYLPNISSVTGGRPSIGSAAPPNKTSQAKPDQKPTAPQQSYLSQAAGYIPSVPSFRRAAPTAKPAAASPSPKPPAPNRAPSGTQKTAALNRTPSGATPTASPRRPSQPARTPSGVTSPSSSSPSIPRRTSGVKSPSSVSRQASGVKSPSSISRTQSGVKSPPSVSRTTSEAQQKPGLEKRRSSAAVKSTPNVTGK